MLKIILLKDFTECLHDDFCFYNINIGDIWFIPIDIYIENKVSSDIDFINIFYFYKNKKGNFINSLFNNITYRIKFNNFILYTTNLGGLYK